MPAAARPHRQPTDDWQQLRLIVASPQPFLSPLDETEWRPAQRLDPYRPRRKREAEGVQERLFRAEQEASGS